MVASLSNHEQLAATGGSWLLKAATTAPPHDCAEDGESWHRAIFWSGWKPEPLAVRLETGPTGGQSWS